MTRRCLPFRHQWVTTERDCRIHYQTCTHCHKTRIRIRIR
jgi:hypothetical protein